MCKCEENVANFLISKLKIKNVPFYIFLKKKYNLTKMYHIS